MATQWYYSKQLGPVSSEQLKQLALSGQLDYSDSVWKEGMTQWASANHVGGLFPDNSTVNMSTESAEVLAVQVSKVVACPKCKTKVRTSKPGIIACPKCQTKIRVSENLFNM